MLKFMHGVVHGKAPDYLCNLISLTDDNDVAYMILGIGKMLHKLGNSYITSSSHSKVEWVACGPLENS